MVVPFCHCINVAVSGQFTVHVIYSLYDISLVSDPDMFALAWVKYHLPMSFPFL